MFNLLTTNYGAIVDIVALVFLLGFALRGLIVGFAKSFVSLFGTIISLLLAVLLCPSVAKFLESEFSLVTTISGSLGNTLNKIFGETIMNTTLEHATEEALGNAGVGGWLISIVLLFKDDINVPTNITLNELLCPTFSYYIVMLIAILVLFILFKILLFLLGEIVKKLYAISLVKHIDRTLGLVLGIISGIIYMEFLIMLISIIPIGFVQEVYGYILSSKIASFINNLNLFNSIMSSISINDVVSFVKTIITTNAQ